VSWLGARSGFSISDAVAVAANALSSRSVGTHAETVTDALSTAATVHLLSKVEDAEAHFAALCEVEPQLLRDDVTQLRALRQAGWPVNSIPHKLLARRSREPIVRALWVLRDRVKRWERAGAGELAGHLEATVAGVVEDHDLNHVVAHVGSLGMDGELLAWSAITFETHNHIRLIWHQTNKLARSFPDRRPADLFAFGWMGLRVALRAYDPERCAFSTYACTRIKGAIRDGVRAETPIPKRLTTYMRKVARVEEDLTQELGRTPHLAEVAAHMGEELDQLKIIPRLAPAASIEELTGDGDRNEPAALVEQHDPADAAVHSARAEAIAAAMTRLSDEDAEAVRLLLLEGCTVAEAKEITGATARQLRQRWARAREVLAGELVEWAPA
jgi:RNA polymerase sigma factor for flagellar operon FliA